MSKHLPRIALVRNVNNVNCTYRSYKIPKRYFVSSTLNQKSFNKLCHDLNIHNAEDWYKVDPQLLQSHLKNIKTPLLEVLAENYPNQKWQPWRFQNQNVPKNFWSQPDNRRDYFDWLGKELGIKDMNDWYQVRLSDVSSRGGPLYLFDGSLQEALASVYPNYEWLPWKFHSISKNYWKDIANQRKFFDWMGKQMEFTNLDEWYNVNGYQVQPYGGRTLLDTIYGGSLVSALKAVYPEHNWLGWKFVNVNRGFWSNIANQRQALDWAASQLKLQKWTDWYNVKTSDISQLGLGSLLTLYQSSLIRALQTAYPEHKWIHTQFDNVPIRYWEKIENQKNFCDWVMKELNFTDLDGWYTVKSQDIESLGGSTLLRNYQGSIFDLVKNVYPQHAWKPWKFARLPRQCWKDESCVSQYIAELNERLHIRTLDDWYRVSRDQLVQARAFSFINHFGGLPRFLKKFYPDYKWDFQRFREKNKKSAQRWLFICTKKIFPEEDVFEDYMHPKVKMPSSNVPLQLDVFVPSLNLALEYQGQQHFLDVRHFGPQVRYEMRDNKKRELCKKEGITLIEVPYWWDKSVGSLVATITHARPDAKTIITPTTPIPIPHNITSPKNVFVNKPI